MLKTHTPICSHSIKQFKSNKWQNNTIWPLQLRDGKSRHCHYSHFVDEKTELQNSSESHLWISFSHIRLWVSIPSTKYQCSPFCFFSLLRKIKHSIKINSSLSTFYCMVLQMKLLHKNQASLCILQVILKLCLHTTHKQVDTEITKGIINFSHLSLK